MPPHARDAAAPWVSIVVPVYNEAARLPCALPRLLAFADAATAPVELLLVDDGSTDGTLAIADAFAARSRGEVRVLRGETNRGKGSALRRGVAATRGELVLLCDADLSAPLEEFGRLLDARNAGARIAIGSRDLPGSRLDPPQPWPRRIAAWLFRALRRRVLLPQLRDTQCGFKLLDGPLARELFAECRCDGWLIDCEVLALAAARGAAIREVPITWRNHPQTRVRPLRDAVRALRELWRIRARIRKGVFARRS
jgi:dolichyl-phosphate beta-glucosyltransferase